jgi:hypothetical protein
MYSTRNNNSSNNNDNSINVNSQHLIQVTNAVNQNKITISNSLFNNYLAMIQRIRKVSQHVHIKLIPSSKQLIFHGDESNNARVHYVLNYEVLKPGRLLTIQKEEEFSVCVDSNNYLCGSERFINYFPDEDMIIKIDFMDQRMTFWHPKSSFKIDCYEIREAIYNVDQPLEKWHLRMKLTHLAILNSLCKGEDNEAIGGNLVLNKQKFKFFPHSIKIHDNSSDDDINTLLQIFDGVDVAVNEENYDKLINKIIERYGLKCLAKNYALEANVGNKFFSSLSLKDPSKLTKKGYTKLNIICGDQVYFFFKEDTTKRGIEKTRDSQANIYMFTINKIKDEISEEHYFIRGSTVHCFHNKNLFTNNDEEEAERLKLNEMKRQNNRPGI